MGTGARPRKRLRVCEWAESRARHALLAIAAIEEVIGEPGDEPAAMQADAVVAPTPSPIIASVHSRRFDRLPRCCLCRCHQAALWALLLLPAVRAAGARYGPGCLLADKLCLDPLPRRITKPRSCSRFM